MEFRFVVCKIIIIIMPFAFHNTYLFSLIKGIKSEWDGIIIIFFHSLHLLRTTSALCTRFI